MLRCRPRLWLLWGRLCCRPRLWLLLGLRLLGLRLLGFEGGAFRDQPGQPCVPDESGVGDGDLRSRGQWHPGREEVAVDGGYDRQQYTGRPEDHEEDHRQQADDAAADECPLGRTVEVGSLRLWLWPGRDHCADPEHSDAMLLVAERNELSLIIPLIPSRCSPSDLTPASS